MGRNYLSFPTLQWLQRLPHLGWVRDICVSKLTNIGSDNGLSPGRRQAIIWTNAGILLVVSPGTNFNEILLEISIQENPFQTVVWKMAAILSRSQCVKSQNLPEIPSFNKSLTMISIICHLGRWKWSQILQSVFYIRMWVSSFRYENMLDVHINCERDRHPWKFTMVISKVKPFHNHSCAIKVFASAHISVVL